MKRVLRFLYLLRIIYLAAGLTVPQLSRYPVPPVLLRQLYYASACEGQTMRASKWMRNATFIDPPFCSMKSEVKGTCMFYEIFERRPLSLKRRCNLTFLCDFIALFKTCCWILLIYYVLEFFLSIWGFLPLLTAKTSNSFFQHSS